MTSETVAVTRHGVTFAAAVARDRVFGVLDTSATVAELQFGATAGTQTLAIGGSSLQLIGAGHFRTNTVLRLTGGTFGGIANVTLEGAFTWTGGTISGGGLLTLSPTCRASIEGSGGKALARVLALVASGSQAKIYRLVTS